MNNKSEKTSVVTKTYTKEQQSKADAVLKGANIAKECIKAVMETQNPDFCWKSGGDVGKTPYGCPVGWFRYLALCYENCQRDFHFVAGVCWNGNDSYVPSSRTNFSDIATCDTGFYKSGALCYKDCGNQGMENCGIGACSADSTKCVSQVVNMALDVITGVAQFAMFVVSVGQSAPATTATNQAVSTAKNMAKSSKTAAFNKVKTSFGEKFKNTVAKAKTQFIENLKDLPLDKSAEWYSKNVCENIYKTVQISLGNKVEPQEIDLLSVAKQYDILGVSNIYDKCKSSTSNTSEGCAQSAMEFAASFDPTGLLTIAAAFVLPSCNVDPITANLDPFRANIRPKFTCPKCENVWNDSQEAGNSGVEYLDRHNVSCPPDKLLNFFSFTQSNGRLVSNYRCITPDNSVSNCRRENSNWDELPRNQGAINFLDRLNVNCGNDFLQTVKLETNGNRMSFSYTCCSVNGSTPLNNVFLTNKNELSSWRTDSFNNIDGVDAGTRNAISSFKPRVEGNKFFYEYKAGLVNWIGGDVSSYYDDATQWQDAGEGSIWHMDRHTPWCSRPNSAMVSFRLERNGENLRVAYKCIINNKISYDRVSIKNTDWSDVGGDEKAAVQFLDRHFVTCPANTVIRGFGIRRQDRPGNLLKIVYGCVETLTGEVITNRTWRSDIGGKKTYYLDRQTYQPLGPDEVLQSFKLETRWNPDLMDYYFSSASLY